METLLDIKKALQEIPDELLKNQMFGCGETCENTVSLIAQIGEGEYEFPKVTQLIDTKYPKLNKLSKLIPMLFHFLVA